MPFKELMPFGKKEKTLTPYNDLFTSFRKDLDYILEKAFNPLNTAGIRLDVKNEEDQIIISAELPGFNEEDISLSLDGNLLNIKAERQEEKEEKEGEFYLKERSVGALIRSLQLPFQAEQNNIEAELDQGILKIRIPKPTAVQIQSKQIPIKKK